MQKYISVFAVIFTSMQIVSEIPEMILGEETIPPGINLIFEGAIKDDVFPSSQFGTEEDSDIHLEVLANWNDKAPRGAPENGFVAYLKINAKITNQKTQQIKSIELLPHINMSDNLHYALNTSLPGNRSDNYNVVFIVQPPEAGELGLHFDWREEVGSYLSKVYKFEYKNLNFLEIANSKRR